LGIAFFFIKISVASSSIEILHHGEIIVWLPGFKWGKSFKLGSSQNNSSWLLSGEWLFQELLAPRELSCTQHLRCNSTFKEHKISFQTCKYAQGITISKRACKTK